MLRYAITNRALYSGDDHYRQDSVLREAARWAAAGIEFIQIREKDLHVGELAALTRKVLPIVRAAGTQTRVLVNSRLDIAVATGADGVHLTSREGELTPVQVREVYRSSGLRRPIVSIACHSAEEVGHAVAMGVDLILFGPVFGKVVDGIEVVPGVGLNALRMACAAATGTAVLALGGVTADNALLCTAAGAAGVAGIRWVPLIPGDFPRD